MLNEDLHAQLIPMTTAHAARVDRDMGTEDEQIAYYAYNNINPDRPLQPFVGDDGKPYKANETWEAAIKDAVRRRYSDALRRANGRGITQEDISQIVGISKATLNNWRCNDGLFSLDATTCARLCDAIGVTIDELRGTAEMGHGATTALSTQAFAERYERLDYGHRAYLSMLLRDFMQAERDRERLNDLQRAIYSATESTRV